jgi:hypothetical protein
VDGEAKLRGLSRGDPELGGCGGFSRQNAATITATPSAIITATFPAITGPGLENALPAV